jgi:hypothetical protein
MYYPFAGTPSLEPKYETYTHTQILTTMQPPTGPVEVISGSREYVGIDIYLNVGDIRHRHLLKSIILISEVFRYRHLSPFRYPTLKKS